MTFKSHSFSVFHLFTFASSPSPLPSHPPLFSFFCLSFLLYSLVQHRLRMSQRCFTPDLPGLHSLFLSFLLFFSASLTAAQCCRLEEERLMAASQKERRREGKTEREHCFDFLHGLSQRSARSVLRLLWKFIVVHENYSSVEHTLISHKLCADMTERFGWVSPDCLRLSFWSWPDRFFWPRPL